MSETTLDRNNIPAQFKWNLDVIYASQEAWEQDFAAVKDQLPAVLESTNHLAQGPQAIASSLALYEKASRIAEKLYNYAHLQHDGDTTVPLFLGMRNRAQALLAELGEAFSAFEPMLLALPKQQLDTWIDHPSLAPYRFLLEDLQRARPHVLSADQERIIAMTAEMGMGPGNLYQAAVDSDLRFSPALDSKGTEHEVSNARYLVALRSPDRTLRKNWLVNYFAGFSGIRHSMTATLELELKYHAFQSRVRSYENTLVASQFSANIPESVYHQLIATVRQNLTPLHQLVALKEKRLGLKDGVHLYDMLVPLASQDSKAYLYKDAPALIFDSLSMLGGEYKEVLKLALAEGAGWIDLYPNKGKSSGAYSSGCYDTYPYILMNYHDELDSLATLAHELGHSVHSYFSKQAQPWHYADYDIFVAEVASTIAETILFSYLIERADGQAEKAFLLDQNMTNIVRTIYYQTMYAEFELAIHKRIEDGEALSADDCDALWGGLLKDYFGPHFMLDDFAARGWMRIPHFYYNYYVYKYATSLSAAMQLFEDLRKDGPATQKKILSMLKAGGSKHPLDILRDAGVDMASSRPVEAATRHFASLLEHLKALE